MVMGWGVFCEKGMGVVFSNRFFLIIIESFRLE